jgi:hypothetical protein
VTITFTLSPLPMFCINGLKCWLMDFTMLICCNIMFLKFICKVTNWHLDNNLFVKPLVKHKNSINNLKSISIWKSIWHRKLMKFTNKHDFLLSFYSFFMNSTQLHFKHNILKLLVFQKHLYFKLPQTNIISIKLKDN